jgi:hypothetical protein
MTQLSPDAISLIRAVLALALLTLVMASWAGVTRLPAMKGAGLELQDAAHTAYLGAHLPSRVRRVNDNYNHLMEAPTVFYAVALAIVISGQASELNNVAAWVFVGLRTLHSIVQATFNRVALRAALYILSWIALAVMIVGPALGAVR